MNEFKEFIYFSNNLLARTIFFLFQRNSKPYKIGEGWKNKRQRICTIFLVIFKTKMTNT